MRNIRRSGWRMARFCGAGETDPSQVVIRRPTPILKRRDRRRRAILTHRPSDVSRVNHLNSIALSSQPDASASGRCFAR